MKLNQLRSLCEIVDHGFNISHAAKAMHTSQPGISKQIRLMEAEIGTALFKRRTRQVLGLTDAGNTILSGARRVLLEMQAMREKTLDAGVTLRIGTTPTQARYIVLPALKEFVKQYPKTELSIRQASPTECAQLVASGEIDIGIATESVIQVRDVTFSPCNGTSFGVITPSKHPLLRLRRRLRLADLARYPLITYDSSFRSGRQIRERFRSEGLEPTVSINVNAVGQDLIKAYVEEGFGIGVLPVVAYDRKRDPGLRMIPAPNLFKPSIRYVITLQGRHLERHQLDFIACIRRASGVERQK